MSEAPASENPRRALRIWVTGRVQGVGFRYFTVKAARRLGLVGRVRNLHDGSVEVDVAGDEETLRRFKSELKKGPPASRVAEIEEQEIEPVPDWDEFEVAYW